MIVNTVTGTAIELYHTDRLGSVRAVSDAAGLVTATWRTDEFGITTATSESSSQPFTYTGEPRDATGLSYLRARYYDPTIGRFISRDTWAGSRTFPASLNRFVYAQNAPVTYTDPSGRCVDPGGPGIRYCIDRFIPGAHAFFLEGGGDNRGANANGGSFRIRQLISNGSDGTLITTESSGVTSVFGFEFQGTATDCGAAASSRVKASRSISAVCRGVNGLLPSSPEIFHLVQIVEGSDGSATVDFVQASTFPSMEIWQYGAAGGPALVYYYDASAQTIFDLPTVDVLAAPR